MTPAQTRIIELVRSYDGVSLANQRQFLGLLVARGVDDPESVVGIKTNCATTALGFLRLLMVKHPLLVAPYRLGAAVEWLFRIGRDLGILHRASERQPEPGWLMHYATPGKSNDHVEWLLGEPDAEGIALHGGGGRPDNAITMGTSSIRWSSGRPLVHCWDVPSAVEAAADG